jgi:AcrR family transcriptional regulator
MVLQIDGYRHGRVPRELRERQLLDVAETVFTELGYEGASIEEVCRRAGVKRPLVYTYFGGKDGLYLACYRRARAELDERLAAAGEGVPVDGRDLLRQAVAGMARAYFGFLADAPGRWDMLYGPGAARTGPIAAEVVDLRFRTVDRIADAYRRYARPGTDERTIAAFAHATSGTGEQLARWWRREPEMSLDDVVALATDFIYTGIKPLAA